MRAVKNNLPTSSGEVGELEGPRWTRAVGIIPPTPYKVIDRLRPCWTAFLSILRDDLAF